MLEILLASLIGALVFPLVARVVGRGAGLIIAILPAGLLAAFLGMARFVERGWVLGDGRNWATSLGVDLTFRLDGFSFLFCLLVTGIGTLVVIYSGAYLTEKSRADRTRFFTLILLFLFAMLGTVLAENLLVMLLFWEATSVLSFLLIGFDSRSSRSRRAALMSLQVTALGGLMLLAAVLMIGHVLGTYSMAAAVEGAETLAESAWGDAIVACLLIAAFTKSAQFPFHFWLPNAMQAPTPASAYLHSATMVKLGIYLLARFEPVFAATSWGREVVITIACITMLIAAVQALRAESFKAALAYSTIASLGILTLLVGLDGPAATVAMVGFLLSHALYKAALFFCAGSVLHATGQHSLRAKSGLARALPLTAIASAGASLSMAGIPPFLGFISKEFLFEAQIESSWELIPLAIAVTVNAAMVGVAGVVTLRPFFLGPSNDTPLRHGESFSLVAPPLLLALAGLIISLDPEWMTRNVLRPAVAAVYGQAVEVNIAVWHGVTPMLLLSAVVITVGALIIGYWRRIHVLLRSLERFEAVNLERLWERSIARLFDVSTTLTAFFQHGDLRRYLLLVVGAAGALAVWSVAAAGLLPRLPPVEELRAAPIIVGLVGLAGAVAATRAESLLSAMIATGLTGFAVAITFMVNGAPDLALTQFTVEALIVVLLTALLLAVPLALPPTRDRRGRRTDAIVASLIAIVLFAAVLDMISGGHSSVASDYFGQASYLAGKGHNVVNVILVDFRAFDTLGETTVIAIAAVLARSLLQTRDADTGIGEQRPVHFSFAIAARPLSWLLIAVSLVILWRGHDNPGGGFVGGLVAALAFAVISLAHGVDSAERRLAANPLVLVAAGMLMVLLSGVPGLLAGGPFLSHLWWEPGGWLPKLGTTMIFDFGVYLVVLGAVLTFLFGLQREAAR